MKSAREAENPQHATVGKVLLFAPSDADAQYLELQKELSQLREGEQIGDFQLLEVFETTEVPKSDHVVDPQEADELRALYRAPSGKVTIVALSADDQSLISRITLPISQLELREALGAIAARAR